MTMGPTPRQPRAVDFTMGYKMIEKLSFIERRLMAENMKPHECVRMLLEVFTTFKPSGDGAWPLEELEGHHLGVHEEPQHEVPSHDCH